MSVNTVSLFHEKAVLPPLNLLPGGGTLDTVYKMMRDRRGDICVLAKLKSQLEVEWVSLIH